MSCENLRGKDFFHFICNKNNKSNKAGIYFKTIALVVLMMITITGFAQSKENHCLKVKIRPTINGQSATRVTIKLLRDSVEVVSIDTTRKRQEVLYLERNASYTIEISAPGRITRKVSVNTTMPDYIPDDLAYKCWMTVELPPLTPYVNWKYVDFPVAIIKYNEEKGRFQHAKDYTRRVQKQMEQEEAEPTATNN